MSVGYEVLTLPTDPVDDRMVEVNVDLEHGWRFWFGSATNDPSRSFQRHGATLKVPRELVERSDAAWKIFVETQAAIEQLYRIQQGLDPYESEPVPDHHVLKVLK